MIRLHLLRGRSEVFERSELSCEARVLFGIIEVQQSWGVRQHTAVALAGFLNLTVPSLQAVLKELAQAGCVEVRE